MPRYIKNSVVTAKVQASAGTDALPTGAANAILIKDVSITPLDAQNISRDVIRGSFGGSEQLVGPASVKLSYSVELAGSGTAATRRLRGKFRSVQRSLHASPIGGGVLILDADPVVARLIMPAVKSGIGTIGKAPI